MTLQPGRNPAAPRPLHVSPAGAGDASMLRREVPVHTCTRRAACPGPSLVAGQIGSPIVTGIKTLSALRDVLRTVWFSRAPGTSSLSPATLTLNDTSTCTGHTLLLLIEGLAWRTTRAPHPTPPPPSFQPPVSLLPSFSSGPPAPAHLCSFFSPVRRPLPTSSSLRPLALLSSEQRASPRSAPRRCQWAREGLEW